MVSISIEEYANLQRAAEFLEILEAAGVDNWEGYDAARQAFHEHD